MELHPMLDTATAPIPGLWYVLTTLGDCPFMRVGHTCTFVRGRCEDDASKVYVIGGANPSGSFCETYTLNLSTFQWDALDSPGLRARYEHAAFVPMSQPHCIYIFGGADQAGNLNDVQMLNTMTGIWKSVTVTGSPPTARTHHTTAAVGDRLIIYSGGHSGADPVGDRQVYSFDASTVTWRVLTVQGDSPKPRHGHVMVAMGNRVFLHGGMAGSHFYNDLHLLDLDRNTWSCVKQRKICPSARAAHSAVVNGMNIFIFGGMNRDGALDDMYKLDTERLTWSKVDLQGPPPACRLDFAMCTIELRQPTFTTKDSNLAATSKRVQETLKRELKPGSASARGSWQDLTAGDSTSLELPTAATADQIADSDLVLPDKAKGDCPKNSEGGPVPDHLQDMTTLTLCLVNGGMDTEGEIFEDSLVLVLPS